MKVDIDYVEHDIEGFDIGAVNQIVCASLSKSRYAAVLEGKSVSLSIALVSSAEIQKINCEYRKKDVPTDVLSFGDYSDEKDLSLESAHDIFLGEIVLCFDFIEKSATIHEVTALFEMGYVLSHGVLHLLGYEHSQQMFALQESISTEYADQLKVG